MWQCVNYSRIIAINVSELMRPIKELATRHRYGSPSTCISGTPMEQMGGQWSLAAYYRSILICSVLCQFFLRKHTRHDVHISFNYCACALYTTFRFTRHNINPFTCSVLYTTGWKPIRARGSYGEGSIPNLCHT